MDNIPAVAGSPPQINTAEFVKVTIYNDFTDPTDTTIITASSAYRDFEIDGQNYSAIGGLLGVGSQQKDLRVTSADTTVVLSGIDGTNIAIVLGTNIRGSKLEITRGFFDDAGALTSTAKRFTGIITSYNVSEDRQGLDDMFTVSVNASNYKSVLANRNAGRRTNKSSWEFFNPTDSSMVNVYSIATQAFDFGKKVTMGTSGGGVGPGRGPGREGPGRQSA